MKDEKKALRREFLARRRAILESKKTSADREIARRFFLLDEYKNARVILLYASLSDEVSTDEIARRAVLDGKRIAFPRCNSDHSMDFLFCSRDDLIPGFHGISEPPQGAPHFEGGENVLCIVPGLVFDRRGYRIGYGGGFYDRFLKDFDGFKVALARADFILDSVPREDFDLPCDIIITEKEVIKCG